MKTHCKRRHEFTQENTHCYNGKRWCRTCRRARVSNPEKTRERHLLRKYGITLADYDRLLAEQDGRCAICRSTPNSKRRLSIDHNHATGQIRGLLCNLCNGRGLVAFHDSHDIVENAEVYLTKAEGRFTTPFAAELLGML